MEGTCLRVVSMLGLAIVVVTDICGDRCLASSPWGFFTLTRNGLQRTYYSNAGWQRAEMGCEGADEVQAAGPFVAAAGPTQYCFTERSHDLLEIPCTTDAHLWPGKPCGSMWDVARSRTKTAYRISAEGAAARHAGVVLWARRSLYEASGTCL